MSEIASEGGFVPPKRPNLDEMSKRHPARNNDALVSNISPEAKPSKWKKAFGSLFGNKTRAAITAVAMTAGVGATAHVATGGESTSAAQDAVASKVIDPPIEFAQHVAGGVTGQIKDAVGGATRPVTGTLGEIRHNLERLEDSRLLDGQEVEPGTIVTAKILYLASDEDAEESNIRTGHVREIDNRVPVKDLVGFSSDKEIEGREVLGANYKSRQGAFQVNESGELEVARTDGEGHYLSDAPVYGKWFEIERINNKGELEKNYTPMSNVEVVRRERPDEPAATPQAVK